MFLTFTHRSHVPHSSPLPAIQSQYKDAGGSEQMQIHLRCNISAQVENIVNLHLWLCHNSVVSPRSSNYVVSSTMNQPIIKTPFDFCVCRLKQWWCNCVVFQALQFLSKAHRSKIQAGGWEKEPGLFKEVVKRAISMGEGENTIQLVHTTTIHTETRKTWCCFIPGNLYT